jgi:branched-chain amino acid transport system ATP-binding protein
MTAVLELRALSGGYTRAPVLRNVDLLVGPGEMVACFGANGAGKTSLLRAITGALPVVTGDVSVEGEPIGRESTWSRAGRGVAHVPEGRHVFKPMSVRENLEVGALASPSPAKIDEVFELFPRLHDRRQQAAGTLSGGEQQMLALGRAFMSNPKVMLIDEMSAGLAPVMTDRLVDGLREIRARGVALLLVEQAPHLVADVIDRAYLLERGSVVGSGTLDELGGAGRIADLYLGIH